MKLAPFKPPFARRLYEWLHRLFKIIEKSDTGRESLFGIFIILIVIVLLFYGINTLREELPGGTDEPIKKILKGFTLLTHFCTVVFVIILFLLKLMRWGADPLRAPAKQIIENWDIILANVAEMEIAKNWFVKPKDMDQVILLAINGYGTEYISAEHRRRIFEDWYAVRPDIFSFVCNKKGQAIGYALILPLKKGDHFQHKGNAGKSMFSIVGLEIEAVGGADFVLIQGVHLIDKELKNIRSASRLVFELLVKIAFFVKDDSSVIYSEVFSNGAKRLLQHMGFTDTGKKGVQGYAIYELKLNGEHEPKSQKTVTAIRQLQERISYPKPPWNL
ncbi:MAG TPA: hypothetical protein VG367_08330 [Mucilaginibacter sp.]|jgi:hypothetical protein|nr:hypothetical protein [Mucilaginibacter sp.]